MAITIDTSVFLSVLLNGSSKPDIIRVTQGEELIAPESLDAELGNIVSSMLKRSRINLSDSKELIKQYENIAFRRTSIRIQEAVELADKLNILAFEAYVLDCCLQYQTPLITLDEKQKRNARKIGIKLLEPSS